MVYKYKVISSNRNAIFSLCETSWESHFRRDVTSFFVGWCIYEKFHEFSAPPLAFKHLLQPHIPAQHADITWYNTKKRQN